MGSVGQRAAKLPAIKLWKWFDPGPTRTQAERACTQFGWNGQSGRLFLENSNFEVGFAPSNRPHLHRAYEVSVWFFLNIFVYVSMLNHGLVIILELDINLEFSLLLSHYINQKIVFYFQLWKIHTYLLLLSITWDVGAVRGQRQILQTFRCAISNFVLRA